jgi:hypothetical protein
MTGQGMAGVAAGTIVAKNFLSFARVLAASFRRHHPDIPLFVLLADEVDGYFEPGQEEFRLLTLPDLAIPKLSSFVFRYSRQQTVVGAKPYLLSHLLDRGFAAVLFLDADMLILNDLSDLIEQVRRHAVTLVPHLLRPPVGEKRLARELNILLSGTYNGGFAGFSNTPQSRRFLSWWQERLYDHCDHSVAQAMHYDQRWLDFAPSFVEDFAVVRDPGCNVAYWNLADRTVEIAGDTILAGGRPCRWFHFSGFEPDRQDAVTRYAPGLKMSEIGPAAELFRRYVALLNRAAYQESKAWPFGYSHFDNGTPIPDVARRLYRALGPESDRFGDPFQTARPGSFFDWLNEPVDEVRDSSRIVTRLWQGVYDERPDVQRVFPHIFGSGRRRYLKWTVRYGLKEHGIPECFVRHLGGPGRP